MKKKIVTNLFALVCAFAILSTGLSANAAEMGEAATLSARMTGSCGCTMKIETASQRSCTDNGDGTHTSVYNVTYVCPHNRVNKIETIKESHSLTGPYSIDKGHDTSDPTIHRYARRCHCGKEETVSLKCLASPGASGGHAVP